MRVRRPAVRPPGRGSAAAPRRSGSARSSAAGRSSRCPGRPGSRRRSGCRRRTTSPPRTSPAAPEPCRPPSAGSRSSPRGPGHVGQVGVAADGVDRVVQLLLAHARPLDVARDPRASRPRPRPGRRRTPSPALLAGYRSRRKRSSPVQRQTRATADGYFDDSSVLPASALAPKKTAPSGVTSCTILPLRPLITLRHVAQGAQVVLDRRELPGRDRRVRGVLAVGAEQPGVVGPAGAEPAHRLQRAAGGG